MSNVSNAPTQKVKIKRVSKGKEPVERELPIGQALEILRTAAKSNIPTWQLADAGFKFEGNEIIPLAGAKPDKNA